VALGRAVRLAPTMELRARLLERFRREFGDRYPARAPVDRPMHATMRPIVRESWAGFEVRP
jgi:hypothetical protein